MLNKKICLKCREEFFNKGYQVLGKMRIICLSKPTFENISKPIFDQIWDRDEKCECALLDSLDKEYKISINESPPEECLYFLEQIVSQTK